MKNEAYDEALVYLARLANLCGGLTRFHTDVSTVISARTARGLYMYGKEVSEPQVQRHHEKYDDTRLVVGEEGDRHSSGLPQQPTNSKERTTMSDGCVIEIRGSYMKHTRLSVSSSAQQIKKHMFSVRLDSRETLFACAP